jgi:hypothetical protein
MLFYLIVYSCLSNLFLHPSGGTIVRNWDTGLSLYIRNVSFSAVKLWKLPLKYFLESLNNQSKFQIIYFVRLFVYSCTRNFFSYLTFVTIYIYRYGFSSGFLLRATSTATRDLSLYCLIQRTATLWDSNSRRRANHCIKLALKLRCIWR